MTRRAMRYRVTLEGSEREIDVQIAPGGTVAVTLDGEPVDADIRRIPGGVSLKLGSKVYDVLVGGPAESMDLAAGPLRATAAVESERNRSRKKKGAAGGDSSEVRAPMPGRIVKILVSTGAEVDAGAPVVVVEAMKMENELRTERAGTIASIEVEEGQAVEGGALLVKLE
jgi:biotin carboxyl carrier protein